MINPDELAGLLVDHLQELLEADGEKLTPIEQDALYDAFEDALMSIFPEPLDLGDTGEDSDSL